MADTSVTTTQSKPVQALIKEMTPAFQQALGTPRMAERFARIALTEVRKNPKLAQCDQMSLMGALMQSAQLGLDFMLGYAYIIPYWSTKRNTYEAQFQIGYQGYLELFYRHPLAQELYAEIVYKNDKFNISKGTNRSIFHEPLMSGEKGVAIGYYAVARLKSGAFNFIYMNVEDVEEWRNRYAKKDRDGGYGVWETEFDDMALKTVIKRVLKLMPKSTDILQAMEWDEGIKRPMNENELKNIDSIPTEFTVEEQEPKPTIEPQKKTAKPKGKEEPPKEPEPAEIPVEEEPLEEVTAEEETAEKKEEKGIDAITRKRVELIDLISEHKIDEKVKEDWLKHIREAGTLGELYSLESTFKVENGV